jgi:hypothetical protein
VSAGIAAIGAGSPAHGQQRSVRKPCDVMWVLALARDGGYVVPCTPGEFPAARPLRLAPAAPPGPAAPVAADHGSRPVNWQQVARELRAGLAKAGRLSGPWAAAAHH